MSREWKPGDVAVVNNRYDAHDWRRAMCVMAGPIGEARWVFADGARVWGSVTEARSLVTIDPEDDSQVERLRSMISDLVSPLQLREALNYFADPKPPKPDEPTGLGAVVEDVAGEPWIRTCQPCDNCLNKPWQSGPVRKNWQIVDAVKVLSEGVTA